MILQTHRWSLEVIWDHLEPFKSWGDKITYDIGLQRSESGLGHSELPLKNWRGAFRSMYQAPTVLLKSSVCMFKDLYPPFYYPFSPCNLHTPYIYLLIFIKGVAKICNFALAICCVSEYYLAIKKCLYNVHSEQRYYFVEFES